MTDNGQTSDGTKGIVMNNTTILYLPVELDGNGSGSDMFTLVAMTREYTEAGVDRVQHELRLRCNKCNWGYNSSVFIRLGDVLNIGHRAKYHVGTCSHTGRTLDLDSPEIGR